MLTSQWLDSVSGIVILYFSEKNRKIVSTFLSMAILESGNAKDIVKCLKNELEKFKLNIKNLIGIGTDNASVMVGCNKSVYTELKKDVPDLILIRCVCHSIQLAINYAYASERDVSRERIDRQDLRRGAVTHRDHGKILERPESIFRLFGKARHSAKRSATRKDPRDSSRGHAVAANQLERAEAGKRGPDDLRESASTSDRHLSSDWP
ncbi:hypothetical protein ALC62_14007 [Cyphomyrmex costatus]|uniref:DUF4371 domain-containing protein n=1 Tax=Cyphomyrmex costatus TaxID=456900 RepID=A0A151I971_9HYME|nr:hypothetical protein ALC62_14007 [Cyphomyrmex costatus]